VHKSVYGQLEREILHIEFVNDPDAKSDDYLLISKITHLNYRAEIVKDYLKEDCFVIDVYDDSDLLIEDNYVDGITVEDGTIIGLTGYARAEEIAKRVLEAIAV
jgi:hypothetical protein